MIESDLLMLKSLVLVSVAFLLPACAPFAQKATTAPLPTVAVFSPTTAQGLLTSTPTSVPKASAPSPPLVQPMPTPTATDQGTLTPRDLAFSDPSIGISFNYPPDWGVLPQAPDDPLGVTIHGPSLGEGPEPIIFAITISVEPASEKSVKEIVDQQLKQVPGDLRGSIKRSSLSVGREPAEQVVGLPSREGAIETFVLHGGRLCLIILQPYDEANESLLPYLIQARQIYSGLLSSLKFNE